MYYSPAAAENCIRGFFHLGFQASYAQKSRNSRLKDLEDRASTNIYCTGVPIEWNESVRHVKHSPVVSLTRSRILQSTSCHTMRSQPRSAEMYHQVSARKLALHGTIILSFMLPKLTNPDSRHARLLSEPSRTFTASLSTTMASSSASALPTPKPRSSSSSKVKNAAIGEAANTATLSSTPLLPP